MPAPPPPPPGADAPPAPGSPDQPPPADPRDPLAPIEAPRPVPPPPVTVHGTVSTFLVGPGGEVRGLVLNTGEQVHLPSRAGEALGTPKADAHPEVAVVGEVVRSEYGIIVRATQLTVGAQTIVVQ